MEFFRERFFELVHLIMTSRPHRVMFSMLFAGIIGSYILYIVDKKLRKSDKTDQEKLFDIARILDRSEYDIFIQAGETWKVSDDGIKKDFKDYLASNEVPFYVRDFIRSYERETLEAKKRIR